MGQKKRKKEEELMCAPRDTILSVKSCWLHYSYKTVSETMAITYAHRNLSNITRVINKNPNLIKRMRFNTFPSNAVGYTYKMFSETMAITYAH
jgi:hypothetical protein